MKNTKSVWFVVIFVIFTVLMALMTGCTTTTTVYQPAPLSPEQVAVQQLVVAPAPYGYGNGAGRVRVSTGKFLGIFPFTSFSTSWSYHIVDPVYEAPAMDIYYSYPSFSAGFEWWNGRLDRHRTWGPSRQQSHCSSPRRHR